MEEAEAMLEEEMKKAAAVLNGELPVSGEEEGCGGCRG